MHKEGLGGYSERYFTGSATMTPTTGSYDYTGKGTGTESGLDVGDPAYPCNEPQRTEYGGPAELTVNARYAIGKFVPGPVTWEYRDNTTEISLEVKSDNLTYHSTGVGTETGCTTESGTYGDIFSCYFYGVDFTVGGSYQINQEGDPDATCQLQVSPAVSTLKISGSVMGNFGSEGIEGISNSRVVLAKLDNDNIEKLSTSKPDFMQKTVTTDDYNATYEFTFDRGSGELPKMLVVSLLWYEGKPEFAITNGMETDGRLIPVYQVLCVDNDPGTKCEKWQETADGYEAVANFEYGNADKLAEGWSVVKPEEWMTGLGIANYSSVGSAVMMADSAYMYYNSYRAMKYFETLGLRSTLQPLVIRSHDLDPDCPDAGAWYNGKTVDSGFSRSFGDLGTYLGKADASGGELVLCDFGGNSSLYDGLAPKLPLWHELGHYLQAQMYNPFTPLRGTPHKGYENPSSNDAVIEGFAGFVAMLIDEHYGGPFPYVYNYQNLEEDIKIWGQFGQDEEYAIAGILWDFHDPGREIDLGYRLNGIGVVIPVSKVYPSSMDDVTLDDKTIITVIERNQPKTIMDVYNAFVGTRISAVNLDMIYVNHGVFADIADRNYIHDSATEKVGESGSASGPERLVRTTPPPQIRGSSLVTDSDARYNVTIDFDDPYSYYDYSYLLDMKAGEKTPFGMPPQYYPSVATLTSVPDDGGSIGGGIRIQSDEYWTYINSGPPSDGVFKEISPEDSGVGATTSGLQYIQNVRDLLNQASTEYRAGNATGAEKLATTAYLDNFEYVESDLEQRNATELKQEIEQLTRVELIGLVKDGADPQAVDDKIAEINAKLDEAITIVPEFPVGMLASVASMLSLVILLGRYRENWI
ncbi:MAG TPA: hypothetical protein VJP79_04770 [Nitrososphaera sp.]|nr:hypothetical protein [Nitrososphaera sp.]